MSTSTVPHIVFYDDRCPLCSGEIGHYKKLVKHHPVDWIGISKAHSVLTEFKLSEEQVLKHLHVLRADGVMVKGAYAFAVIWSSLKYYRILGWLVRTLRLLPVMQFAYRRFAEKRFDTKYKDQFECVKEGLCKR